MNKHVIFKYLGILALLIGASMSLSLPWSFPLMQQTNTIEVSGLLGMLGAMAVSGIVGGVLLWLGRSTKDHQTLFRREAIAVVAIGWLMATVLGAVPFWLSDTYSSRDQNGEPIKMGIVDGLFESGSGFSGTGATVLTDLERSDDPDRPALIPRSILFWRSETHFLGGLGILVLFVAILGAGSTGKALLMTEMPGPGHETPDKQAKSAARIFAYLFISLTAILTLVLLIEGMSLYDALCHSFGAIATGGYSTHNKSIEYFNSVPIEMTLTLFMVIACTNFTLLHFVVIRQPDKLIQDSEFRVYIAILLTAATVVVVSLLLSGDFGNLWESFRYGIFQVVSIMTNTGYGTSDFNSWNSLARAILLLLMFIGGCAGSTSCSIKVIRYIVLAKVLSIESEKVFRPSAVRSIRIGGKPLENQNVAQQVILFFALAMILFVLGWLILVAVEPTSTWTDAGHQSSEKLIDCASAVAATLNGVGPGFGIVGESENYSHFHSVSKLVLTWLMLLGRLEYFVLLVILTPRFWRR